MENEQSGSFESLNPDEPIFKEIKKQEWWKWFCEDPELYIDIRKANYINIYYYGGSLVKIEKYSKIKNKFITKIHKKYLGKNKKGYISLNLKELDKEGIEEIKKNIRNVYLKESKKEKKLKEKKIQGEMICKNSKYIDSEFEYKFEYKNDKFLRIDFIELSNGILSFVELKQIEDSRLRNDEKQNLELPEIIYQMDKYKNFISKYENEIIDYYKKIIQLKNDLGILKQKHSTDFKLNKTPKLIIANTYKELSKGKIERIRDIEDLLKENKIDYKIIPWHPDEKR